MAVATAIAVLTPIIACGGDGGPAATPTPSASDGTVPSTTDVPDADAFIIYRDGLGNIVALDTSTGDAYTYSVDPTAEVIISAECTADGSHIAFLRQDFSNTDRELLIVDAAGEQRFALPPGTQSIAWSPDASRIAYLVYAPTIGYTLATIDIATGEETEQIKGIGVAGGLGWSPDGTRLAYQAPFGTTSEIWLYTVDSFVERPDRLTTGPGAFDPEWASDGQHLLASSIADDGSFQIVQIDANTGETTAITDSADIYKRLPRYSPDGGTIAYTGSIIVPTVSRFALAVHSFGVFLMDSDGSNQRALTSDPRLNPGQGVDPFLDAILIGWCRSGDWLDASWTPLEASPTPVIQ